MSAVFIDEIPREIIFLIISFLENGSLLAVMRTARFLRPHAEYLLYRKVDLHSGRMSQTRTIDFLIAVVRNPRLGIRVLSFHPQIINYHIALASTGEFVDLLAYATQFLPNLKTIIIRRCYGGVPEYFKWNAFQIPPFQLQRLSLRIDQVQNASTCSRDLLQLLQHQCNLRHFCLYVSMESKWAGGITLSDGWPSLEIVEATSSVIPLPLRKGRVKSLLWECDCAYQELLGAGHDLETELGPHDAIFAPELCEAYGCLENLVIHASDQLSFLPTLSTFLSLLKTLRLCLWEPPYISEPRSSPLGDKFMGAIGAMGNLEVLVIGWSQDGSDMSVDPSEVFAASRSLKYFSFIVHGDPGTLSTFVYMERGADGAVCPVVRDTIFDIPYVSRGWFTYDTEDEIATH